MLCLEFFEQLNSGELIEDKENARMQIIYGEEFDWIQFKVYFFKLYFYFKTWKELEQLIIK